ncbi:MAG: nitroreductase family protein [Alphaproteobacteria bacterium]
MSTPIEFLATRRSVPTRFLGPPGPDEFAREQIVAAGIRVPDHGKLTPWRFILLDGTAREQAGDMLLKLRLGRGDTLSEEDMNQERLRFSRAPLVIGVVSRAAEHPKIPVWEQRLSAGAVCMNLLNAAHALGFSAQWLTDWPAYDPEACSLLGLKEGERLAGFVHIGTARLTPTERPRPSPSALSTFWSPPFRD